MQSTKHRRRTMKKDKKEYREQAHLITVADFRRNIADLQEKVEHEKKRADNVHGRRIDELEKELADIKEAHEATLNEVCEETDDRKHCACVPFLRAEIEALKQSQGKGEKVQCIMTQYDPAEDIYTEEDGEPIESQGKLSEKELATLIERFVLTHKFAMTGLADIRSLATAIHKAQKGEI